MENQMNSMINRIHKKVNHIVPVMLLIKYYSIRYTAFYFLMFIFKFISALIITNNFNLTSITSNQSIAFLRFFTAHSIISSGITITKYIIICFVIIIIQCANIIHFIWYYYYFKKRSKPTEPRLSKLFIILIHFHILFGQLQIEFLSFPYYILGFKGAFPIKNTFDQSLIIFFAVLNTIVIIIINMENYIIFQSINTPFTQNTYPIKIKFSIARIGLILFMENIVILECFDLYAQGIHLKAYKIGIFIVFGVCLFITGILSLNEFNFKNALNDFLAFLSSCIFTSVVIEVIIYLTGTVIENSFYLLFVDFWKIIVSIIIVYIMKIFNRKRLKDNSKTILFKVYDYKLEENDIDTFLFILQLLSELGSGSIDSQELLSILYQHKKECFNEKCKCQLIQLFICPDTKTKDEYIKALISRIGFLIETSFVQIDYSYDYNVSMLLAEYFFYFKNNSLMAYSIIQTYFYSNLSKMSLEQIITVYSISQKYIIKSTELISQETVNYSDYYYRFRQEKEIYKNMIFFYENFNSITNAKSSFENSIKIIHDINSGEITKIVSSFLTSVSLNTIIKTMTLLAKTYISIIKKVVEWSPDFMAIEYYYKVYLFFYSMNAGKLPTKIKVPINKYINQHNSINNLNTNSKLLSIDLTSILCKVYDSWKYTYTIIVKFCKGFKIVYFSEKLANDLGFSYSSLIGEDLSVIFPQNFREIHHKAMINFIITQEHYSYTHSSYIFTSQGHSIPAIITISSNPGIGKDLTIICNIKILPNENKFSYILNEKYEAISVSETFDTKYALSLKLVNDFDINLLEIFNIQSSTLEQSFNNQIKKIEKFKRGIEVNTELAFSRILYTNHLNYNNCENDLQFKKFKLFEPQREFKLKDDELIKSKIDIENLYSHQPTKNNKKNSLILKRCKSEIVQNLINLINKFNEMEVYDERYKKLNEALYKFKHSMKADTFFNNSPKETFEFIEAIGSSNYPDSCYYHIKVIIKEIFDQPLYLVKLTEVIGSPPETTKKFSVTRAPLGILTHSKRNKNSIIKNIADLKSFQLISPKSPQSPRKRVGSVQFNSPKSSSSPRKLVGSVQSNQTMSFQSKSSEEQQQQSLIEVSKPATPMVKSRNQIIAKPTESLNQKSEVLSLKKKMKKLFISITNLYGKENNNNSAIAQIKIKRTIKIESTFLIVALFICLILSLGIALDLLLFQQNILNIYHLLFINIHYILAQRDKLLNIYCLSLGMLYKVSTITTTDHANATIDDVKPYFYALIHDSQGLDELYHNFYYAYLNYKDKEKKSYSEMLMTTEFQKIKLNWKPLKYSSDFFTEIQYLSILYNKVIIREDSLEDVYQDSEQFLFNTFFKFPDKEVKSNYGRLLFYFGSNYLLVYENFIKSFVENINEEIASHYKDSAMYYMIIQALDMLVYIALFSFVFYYLVKHNTIIFKSIVRMFVFTSPEEKYTYQNQYYNYSLFQKINNLINLTNNFNIDNLTLVLLTDKLRNQYNNLSYTQISQRMHHNNTENSISPFANEASFKSITSYGLKRLPPSHKILSANLNNVKGLHSGKLLKKGSLINTNNNTTLNNNSNNTATTINNTNNNTLGHLNSTNNTHSQIQLTRTQTKRNEIDEINEKNLTKTLILDNIVNSGLQVIKWLELVSGTLFLIFLIYFFINTILFLSMIKQIQYVFIDYFDFVNYYSLAYLYFNELRIKIISPYNTISNELFDEMTDSFAKMNTDIRRFINNRLDTFPTTNKLFHQLNRNTTDGTREELQYLCNNNTQCMFIIIRNKNEIISQGINIAVDSIFLQLTNVYGDFLRLKETLQTVDEVRSFLEGNQMDNIEETLSFVLNNVKEVLFMCLFNDENNIMASIGFQVSIFDYFSFGYCFLVFILIMFGIILNVQRHVKSILYSSYKINRMFYYNYLEDNKDGGD